MFLLPAPLHKRGEGKQTVQIQPSSRLHFVLLTKQTGLFYLALVFVRWACQSLNIFSGFQKLLSGDCSLLDETKTEEISRVQHSNDAQTH